MGSHRAGRGGSGLARPGGCGTSKVCRPSKETEKQLRTPGSLCFPFPPFYVTFQSSVSSTGSNERRKKDTEKMLFKSSSVFCLFVRGSSEILDEEKIVIMGPD